jgi:ribonuclease HI
MYFDDSKMLVGLGAGVILTSPIGDNIRYVLQIMYTNSNSAAEYEALLHGLRMAVSMGVHRLEVRGGSNLAISQVNGEFDTKDPKMAAYRNAILKIFVRFEELEFHHVSKDINQAADILARMGTKRDPVPQNTFLERLFKPSVVWQDGGKDVEVNDPGKIIPPIIEPDEKLSGARHSKKHLRPTKSWQ